jgi:RNA polymerase sigma factor (sigma-70 family)
MEQNGESSFELIQRAQQGDHKALNTLLERHLPRLRRWASGRLPRQARDSVDTDDLVQETVVSTLKRIEGLEYQREGALQAYMRQTLMNRIRDRIRRANRRPTPVTLDDQMQGEEISPLDEAIGHQAVERYEAALQLLDAAEREAIVGRLELGLDYTELAQALGKPSADAARMAVSRAMLRLAERMKEALPRTTWK